MASTVGRGTQTMNTMYIKPMMRKAGYHKKGNPATGGDTVKINGEEMKVVKGFTGDNPEWVPDHRTGIFYPKGQEKVIADIPPPAATSAGKYQDDVRINWFSNHEDFNI